jgi:hypothetical protein
VAVPQKNPFGNVDVEEALNCAFEALAGSGELALEDPLHAENSAGRPTAAPAPSID